MGVKLQRAKSRKIWLSVLYRFFSLPFASKSVKQKMFLNLEWLFDRLSHENSFNLYDDARHPVRKSTRDYLLDRIQNLDVVLDLGCDKGVMSNYLADKAKKVVGIDYHEYAINIAKSNYQKDNLEFVVDEALHFLEKRKEEFSTLILSHILEHLDDPHQFLMDFKGYFQNIYIEVPDFERHYLNQYRKDLDLSLIYSDDDHITEFDRNEMSALLSDCGIEILESEFRHGVQRFWCKSS